MVGFTRPRCAETAPPRALISCTTPPAPPPSPPRRRGAPEPLIATALLFALEYVEHPSFTETRVVEEVEEEEEEEVEEVEEEEEEHGMAFVHTSPDIKIA
ncbi:unnamed protein product [Gadus morhua 'NCC']